jgi:hypothetical protein
MFVASCIFNAQVPLGVDLDQRCLSFHLGWTFHKAGPNLGTRPRSVMTMIYMDADMRLAPSLNPVQANDAAQWCPGVKPGDRIDTALNPVIFEG